MAKSFEDLFREAKGRDDYWIEGAILDFTDDVCRLMDEIGVSRVELARRIGTSPAYVTKLLRGNVNFTLSTMVRVARALHATVKPSLARTEDAPSVAPHRIEWTVSRASGPDWTGAGSPQPSSAMRLDSRSRSHSEVA
jgi:transcriptional regulator with XRE-family HTH domain